MTAEQASSAFTVFARPRPIRTSFLVDSLEFDREQPFTESLLDGIVSWGNSNWGGRYSQIIYTPLDRDFTTEDWNDLSMFDPDRLQVFGNTTDSILLGLDDRLSLWDFEAETVDRHEENSQRAAAGLWVDVSTKATGTPVPPSLENLKRFQRDRFLIFDFAKACPLIIRRFLHRNFGTYHQWIESGDRVRRLLWLEETLSAVAVDQAVLVNPFHLDGVESFRTTMATLSGAGPSLTRFGFRLPFLAPCELGSLCLPEPFRDYIFEGQYLIVVGDRPEDFVSFLNLSVFLKTWHRPYENLFWIPTGFFEDPKLIEALVPWIHLRTNWGSGHIKEATLLSASRGSDFLSGMAEKLKAVGCKCRVQVGDFRTLSGRIRGTFLDGNKLRRPLAILDGNNSQRLIGSKQIQTFTFSDPELFSTNGRTGVWAVDLQIERLSEPGGSDHGGWWFLPRRSGRGLAASIIKGPVRVNADWLLSAQVERREGPVLKPVGPELQIAVPSDFEAIRTILLDPRGKFRNTNAIRLQSLRSGLEIEKIGVSSNGEKLQGLLSLFRWLSVAKSFCERRFWRQTFTRLAGRDARYDATFKERLENKISKALRGEVSHEKVKPLAEQLRTTVFREVTQRIRGEPVAVTELKREVEWLERSTAQMQQAQGFAPLEYPDGDRICTYQGWQPLSMRQFERDLDRLINLEILRPQYLVRCDHCGEKNFLNLNELNQAPECRGCGQRQRFSLRQDWYVTLNTLAAQSTSSGVLAVLHALGNLQHGPTSFFFAPSLDLYLKSQESVWRELDIVCVINGELLIGEVKGGDIEKSDFARFTETAKELRPDRASIFVDIDRLDQNVSAWFQEMKIELDKVGIRAGLHALALF